MRWAVRFLAAPAPSATVEYGGAARPRQMRDSAPVARDRALAARPQREGAMGTMMLIGTVVAGVVVAVVAAKLSVSWVVDRIPARQR